MKPWCKLDTNLEQVITESIVKPTQHRCNVIATLTETPMQHHQWTTRKLFASINMKHNETSMISQCENNNNQWHPRNPCWEQWTVNGNVRHSQSKPNMMKSSWTKTSTNKNAIFGPNAGLFNQPRRRLFQSDPPSVCLISRTLGLSNRLHRRFVQPSISDGNQWQLAWKPIQCKHKQTINLKQNRQQCKASLQSSRQINANSTQLAIPIWMTQPMKSEWVIYVRINGQQTKRDHEQMWT